MSWSTVDDILQQACVPESLDEISENAAFPGAVLLVGRRGEILHEHAVGCRSLRPEKRANSIHTVYDVASLTKPLITTTLMMQLVDKGMVDLDWKLSRLFQTFATLGKERMTIRQLLNHSSGFPAHSQLFRVISQANKGERTGILGSRGAVEMIRNEVSRLKLEHVPGKISQYSDLGFILLEAVIESLSGGSRIDRVMAKQIAKPLKLRNFGYIDLAFVRRNDAEVQNQIIAPTQFCAWRKAQICAEVSDENASAMGGVAGHAGLFTTARDIHTLLTELIACYHGKGMLVRKHVIQEFWKRSNQGTVTTKGEPTQWALGWETATSGNSSAGKYFTPEAVGHTGFTGCSVWVEPEKEIDIILLSNRVHLSVENVKIRELRPKLHDAIWEALGEREKSSLTTDAAINN